MSAQNEEVDPFAHTKAQTIASREDQYRQRRMQQEISPPRFDPFADGGKTPDPSAVQYKDIMRYQVGCFVRLLSFKKMNRLGFSFGTVFIVL